MLICARGTLGFKILKAGHVVWEHETWLVEFYSGPPSKGPGASVWPRGGLGSREGPKEQPFQIGSE